MKDYKNRILEILNTILLYHKIYNDNSNENPFRIKSYIQVIHSIENFNEPITKKTDLSQIKGIGKGFNEKINTIIATNTLEFYEEIKKDKDFKNLVELYNLTGVGPKKLEEFMNKGIKSIKDLKEALKNNSVKVSESTLLHLKYYKDLQKKLTRKEVENIVNEFIKVTNLKRKDVIIAGSYRLGKKESKDIDLILIDQDLKTIIKKLKDYIKGYFLKGSDKVNLLVKFDRIVHIDIRNVDRKYLAYYLLYFGSGSSFSRTIRQEAKLKGYKLDQYGLSKNGKYINFYPSDEKDIFKFLKIDYVEPEHR